MQKVNLTRELKAQGYDQHELERLAAAGQLTRVRRGAYALPAEADARQAHCRLIDATVRQTPVSAVVSHSSAAALLGLPLWSDSLSRVHLTRQRTGGGKIRRYVHLHVAALTPVEITRLDGLAVTTAARTAVDLARTLSYARAVAVGDAAMRSGTGRAELEAILSLDAGRHGSPAARRVVGFLDGRSESVGESESRVALYRAGLPPPELQYEVRDGGEPIGRSDFAWPDWRTLGEFDGKIKYGRLLKPGETASDAVFREKLREDALRDRGWQVVRWTWDDLNEPDRLAERLSRAFRRGSHAA